MGARQKLNGAYFNGALITASGIGWIFNSFSVGLIVFVGCIFLALKNRDIRPDANRR